MTRGRGDSGAEVSVNRVPGKLIREVSWSTEGEIP